MKEIDLERELEEKREIYNSGYEKGWNECVLMNAASDRKIDLLTQVACALIHAEQYGYVSRNKGYVVKEAAQILKIILEVAEDL